MRTAGKLILATACGCVISVFTGLFMSAQNPVARTTPVTGAVGLSQTCTNQALTAINTTGTAGNCKTITSAYVDGSIATNGPLGTIQTCYDTDGSHTGGSGARFVCNTPSTFTPVDGSAVKFRFASTGNAAAPQVNVNGLGLRSIFTPDQETNFPQLAANVMIGDGSTDLNTGPYYLLIYNGNGWILQQNTVGNTLFSTSNTATLKGLFYAQGTGMGVGPGAASVDTGCTTNGTGSLTCINFLKGGVPINALSGTTSSIGGTPLLAGACATGTVSIGGATTDMVAIASPAGGVDPSNGGVLGVAIDARVSSSGIVTVSVCAPIAGTPTAAIYNVRVIQ